MAESRGQARDPFEGLILDDEFVRGGRFEPPARTRHAIGRLGGQDTSWRHPLPAAVVATSSTRRMPRQTTSPVSAVFVGLVAAFGVALAAAWETGSRVAVFAIVVLGWLVSLCLHEFGHALVAHAGGDRSVAVRGYLRLDIRRYVHPVLSFVLPVLFVLAGGIGLPGGAVWIDHGALRTRRARSLTSLAGPAANALGAAACLVPLAIASRSDAALQRHLSFWAAVAFLGFLQISAVIINLLPVPGLDGWGVLEPYLRDEVVRVGRRIAPFGVLILFFVLLRSAFVSGPIGRVIVHVETATGVPSWLAAYGDHLFRFWS